MSRRLWGACASQAGMLGTALGADRVTLTLPGEGEAPMGWGIGFYQGGEPLVRKTPLEGDPEVDLHAVLSDIDTDVLMGHVREPTVGSLRAENTHPFRFRQWMFAHSGTIARFDDVKERMLDAMPAFLQRSINGDTDSEIFFHLVLAFLYDARRLEDQAIEPAHMADAMIKAVLMVDKLESDAGGTEQSPHLLLLSNGYCLLALRRSTKGLAYMAYEAPGRAEVRPRAVLVACERTHRGGSWQQLPNRSVLQIRRDLSVEVTEF